MSDAEKASVKGGTEMPHMQHKRTLTLTALILASACAYLGLAAVGSATAQQGPPVNTALPTITGTPRVGQTLTAQNGT